MVYLCSPVKFPPVNYITSFGIIYLDEETSTRSSLLNKFIVDNNIDIIFQSNPMRLIQFDGIEIIGIDQISAELETHKFKTRENVKRLGIKVPELLSDVSAPCVVKPKVLSKKKDCAQVCFTKEDKPFLDFDYYVEEFIENIIEVNVAYVVAKGTWSILHTQQVIGEDIAKRAGKFAHWTNTSSFKELSKESHDITIERAAIILDWMASLSNEASYIGQLTGLLTKDGEWYFCENNVRPEMTNSIPHFISGEEWLTGMRGNPNILAKGFADGIEKVILKPKEPDSPYPFHLHRKYNVAVPCGIDIIDGEYRVAKTMRNRSPDNRVGIVVCDKKLPKEFLAEIESDGNYQI